MSEEKRSKEDKAFTTFLLLALKALEITSYVGMVAVCGIAAWAIWKSGWKGLYEMSWLLLGVCVILIGSIWGAKLLRRLVL